MSDAPRQLCRHRLRRVMKWSVLAVCLALAGAYVASARWAVYLRSSHGNGIGLWPGRLAIERGSAHVATAMAVPRSWLSEPLRPRLSTRPIADESEFRFGYGIRRIGAYRAWFIPLWWLLAPAASLTGVPWTPEVLTFVGRLRLARPGCCPCGYDLTGNTTGVCPECGKSTSP